MSRLAGSQKPLRVLLALYWIALCVGSHWPRMKLGQNSALPLGMDKWLHIGGYAGLMAALCSQNHISTNKAINIIQNSLIDEPPSGADIRYGVGRIDRDLIKKNIIQITAAG